MATRPYVDLPFGPLLPDYGGMPVTDLGAYLTDCVNLRSTPNGYRGMPTFSDVASATVASGASVYAAAASFPRSLVDVSFFFVNDGGGVFESRAEGTDTWQNVSPAIGTVGYDGDFIRFGNDIIYVSSTKAPVVKDLTATHATLFTNLAGAPPTGICGARVRQHAVIGGVNSYDVRTSAIGVDNDWPTPGTADALAKEAISETLNSEFGKVVRIAGGEKFGVVFQERALSRMTYVGGSNVYEFDTYERRIGCGSGLNTNFFCRPVSDGGLWYFYNETGLYATDGYSIKSLSEGKIDEAIFLNFLSHALGSSLTASNSSVYDKRRGLIIFANEGYSGGTSYQLVYDLGSGNITWMQHTNSLVLFRGYRTSSTLNIRDECVYNVNGSNRKLQRLNVSSTPTIALQTGYIELDPGYKTQLTGAHLLGAGVPGSLSLAYKSTSLLSAVDVAQTGFTTLTAAPRGMKATGRSTEQFHAFRVTGTGAESQLLKGIRVYFERGEPAT